MIDKKQYDLIIIGSGAAGMTTAAVAANEGLDVIVIEKTELIGGNTSFSGGMVYVPNNSAMEAAGVADDPEMALRYLDATVPTEDGRDMRKQFIEKGREAIDYLNQSLALTDDPQTRQAVEQQLAVVRHSMVQQTEMEDDDRIMDF